MYRIVGVFLFSLLCFSAFTQDEDPRIHRFGVSGVYSNSADQQWGAEISYQIYLKGIRRLEIDFGSLSGTSWDIFQFTGVYQWRLIRKGGFNFYTGPGLGVGYANYGYGEDKFYFAVVGDIGVDYTFRFPIQLGFNYRPGWTTINDDLDIGITNRYGFAIRFAF